MTRDSGDSSNTDDDGQTSTTPATERLAMTAEHVTRVLEQIAPNLEAAGLANEAYLLRVAVRALRSALENPKTPQDPDPDDRPDEDSARRAGSVPVARVRPSRRDREP